MDSVNFGGAAGAGEEIERALMDLGPLLGVTIKEEAPDEPPDAPAPAPRDAVGSMLESVGGAGADGEEAGAGGGAGKGEAEGEGEGADSLASPEARATGAAAARCVLCRAPLALADGTPKLMECLHSACEPCVRARVDEKMASNLQRDFLGAERITITCPACRLQCQPANMIEQRFVLERLAAEQGAAGGAGGGTGGGPGAAEQQCNSCEDTEPATSYCVDCAEFICDNCVHAHQRLKITKDHTIKSKEEAVAELQAAQTSASAAHDMFCREHPQERLSLFCETCDRLTCRDCQLQHHRDHKYQFSTEMAAQARASIAALLSEVSYKRVLLGSAMKVIRDRQQLIADKKKALVHEITQTVVKLTNAINTRGKQLVLRLSEVCDGKQRTLSEKKEALEQLAAITDHCVGFVSGALQAGSDTAVLYSKRAVCAHLQRIKSRRADIPNPEIPVRISLALDKLPDLVRVLSTIGAIVVDGKVDGGAGGAGGGPGGAQGPYHPPAVAAASAPAVAASPHSAVVALQHVAMHQSYVQAAGVGGAGAAAVGYLSPLQGGLRARAHGAHGHAHAHTPLRHAHVTSTTHPHHLTGMNEMNLRGLLNASGQRALAPRAVLHQHAAQQQQQAMQHAYQQMLGAYANTAYAAAASGGASGRRSGGPRTPSPAPPHYPAASVGSAGTAAAKWHIPQQGLANGGFELCGAGGLAGGGAGADYKITLGRLPAPAPAPPASPSAAPARPAPAIVTSTNPKTPSPSLNGGVSMELDKVCAESVQDLMATIAKLDSNGVQVVAEGAGLATGGEGGQGAGGAPAASPLVHSSTDGDKPTAAAVPAPGPAGGGGASDPNEDWCAVCMDGGELMCCDKCPKVFHQYCHIPTIEKLPDETETWQCLLCVNFSELPPEDPAAAAAEAEGGGLSSRTLKIVERITLELYCQYELSLAFREPVPTDNLHYHAKISRPMCLDMIRMKLQPRAPARYAHPAHFVQDCRLLFRNAYRYNPVESQIYKDARRLEEFFDAQLVKWLPEYAYWGGDGEPPCKRARLLH